MTEKESNSQTTLDLLIGVIPTLILYGNFIFTGIFFGIKDVINLNNPIDEIFLISVGGLVGLLGLALSLGNTTKKVYAATFSVLIIFGICTASYVVYSLYTEPDAPDSLFEKIVIIPLFGSIIVGLRRLFLCLAKI